MTYEPKNISRNLKNFRNYHDLTQVELSNHCQIHVTAISMFENGTRVPSLKNLCKLAAGLHVSPNFLLS